MSFAIPKAPDDARWQRVTAELFASANGEHLRNLIKDFEPLGHEAAWAMARWLCDVADGSDPAADETYVICRPDELLGFFAAERTVVELTHSVWPIIELRSRIRERGPQPALLLTAIARSVTSEERFGHVLFDYAVAVARDIGAVVLLVDPDNEEVDRVWRERYGLHPMSTSDAPGRLYFPTSPAPAADSMSR